MNTEETKLDAQAIDNKPVLSAVFLSVDDKLDNFKNEFKALLAKYKAEITIENFGRNWSDDEKIVIDFEWDHDLCDRTNSGSVPQWIVGRWENGR